jgi:uncharacterized membrane protein YdjX (TVP38/TMEM64 family)
MRSLLLGALGLALAGLVVLAVHPLREAVGYAFHGDVHGLRTQLRGLGAAGAAVLFAVILLHAVVFFPAEIVNATAGLVYGFGVALPLVMAAWTASLLIAYGLGAALGRPLALRLAGARRVEMAERVLERGGVPALLLARLVPFVPSSLVGYVSGSTRVPVWRYAWTSALGTLPLTAAAVYLGHRIEHFSASDPLVWVAIGVIAMLAASTLLLTRRLRAATARR